MATGVFVTVVTSCVSVDGDHVDPVDGSTVVARHFELAGAGDIEGALELLAVDATWSFDGLQVLLGEPTPDDAAWLAEALGLPAGAPPRELVGEILRTLSIRRARPALTECAVVGSVVSCMYEAPDAFSRAFGVIERGRVEATIAADRISGLVLTTADAARERAVEEDAFRRWAAVRSTGAEPAGTFIAAIGAEVDALDAWLEAGRPDIERPATGPDPVEIVLAWLDARNRRDFVAMVGLMAGDALDSSVGSWAEFEAARLLDRVIVARSCEVTAEGERLGAFVACDVEISDIIVGAAGATSTNLNQSTFRVRDDRVVALPQYFPSSYVAESAIERWAEDAEPAAYGAACPDGIAGQSPVDGLACARFIAGTVDRWGPIVADLGLGG